MTPALEFSSLQELLQTRLSLFDFQHHSLEGKVACDMQCPSCKAFSLYIHTVLAENKTSHDLFYRRKDYCMGCSYSSPSGSDLNHAEVLDLYREVA